MGGAAGVGVVEAAAVHTEAAQLVSAIPGKEDTAMKMKTDVSEEKLVYLLLWHINCGRLRRNMTLQQLIHIKSLN